MTRYERFGERDLTFSQWHRTLPNRCTCIDIDFLEYCQRCRAPLALIEIARDVGQPHKSTVVMQKLAEAAGIVAYVVIYTKDSTSVGGIGACRIAEVAPNRSTLTPVSSATVGQLIEDIHDSHDCRAAWTKRREAS